MFCFYPEENTGIIESVAVFVFLRDPVIHYLLVLYRPHFPPPPRPALLFLKVERVQNMFSFGL